MKQLILASHNENKVKEIRALLADEPVEVLSLSDIGWQEEIEETGSSFAENASLKARRIFEACGKAVLADDSGLCVEALGGAPGVFSARYMGEETSYDIKNNAIIRELEGKEAAERGAAFVCVMAFLHPDREGKPVEKRAEGIVRGEIAHCQAGSGGFGYAPIFYLPERGCTMAEISAGDKNAISHRGNAIRAMLPLIKEWLREEERSEKMEEDFSILSWDGKTMLHGMLWKTTKEPKGIVQLVHGMAEHIARYDEFARFLNDNGYHAIGHDHLGHGESISGENELGYFAKKKGLECVLGDMLSVTKEAKKLFPGLPVYMLGHSMGSYFTRRYITVYPKQLAGLILSGTGDQSYRLAHAGKRVATRISLFMGGHTRSQQIYKMAMGSFGEPKDWICTRPEVIKAYQEDPKCGFILTARAYGDFFRLLEQLALGKGRENIPKDLPVLLISGMKDPVGEKSKGVLRVYNRFKEWEMTHVDVIFYKDDMHEVLNEADREDVYRDVLRFLDERGEK